MDRKATGGVKEVIMAMRCLVTDPKEVIRTGCLNTNIFHTNIHCGDQVMKLVNLGKFCLTSTRV